MGNQKQHGLHVTRTALLEGFGGFAPATIEEEKSGSWLTASPSRGFQRKSHQALEEMPEAPIGVCIVFSIPLQRFELSGSVFPFKLNLVYITG